MSREVCTCGAEIILGTDAFYVGPGAAGYRAQGERENYQRWQRVHRDCPKAWRAAQQQPASASASVQGKEQA